MNNPIPADNIDFGDVGGICPIAKTGNGCNGGSS